MKPLISEKVRVSIFGREYEMDAGGLTPLEASQLATYVDSKMREIAENLHIVDTQKIAVLAALNIAFELGQRHAEDSLSEDDEVRIDGMLRTLDKALKSA
jgi:cell division protein ZapA